MATEARDVFINCPFDHLYRPIFYAIVFSVLRSGFLSNLIEIAVFG